MYERLYREQERSSSEREYSHSTTKKYEFKNDEIDASNPPPLIIKVEFHSDSEEEFYYKLYYKEPHYEYNEVARNCVIAPLNARSIYILEELKLPNSILMEAYEKIKNKFKNTQYIQFNGGDEARMTKETYFSKEKSENKGYKVKSWSVKGQLSEILGAEKSEMLTQKYRTYQSNQPLQLDYAKLSQKIYDETVHNYNRSEYIEEISKELMFINQIAPMNLGVLLYKRFSSQIGLYLKDTFYTILGTDEDEILEVLLKVDGHPPSIDKLKATFVQMHNVELDDFINQYIPSYRKEWSRLLPSLQTDPLLLDYEKMASTIHNYYTAYLKEKEEAEKHTYFPHAGLYPTTQTKPRANNHLNEIRAELAKLKRNTASIEQLVAHIDVLGVSLNDILHNMGLDKELSEYLQAPIEWKDQVTVENKAYSKDEIIEREREYNKIFEPKHKTASGYLIRHEDTGAYGYLVFNDDNIEGITQRFEITQYDLELANFWYGVHENGQYEDCIGTFWIHEGDILYLPEHFTPKNGTLYYSYNKNTGIGKKVRKEQGRFEKNFLGENLTYKYLKDRLLEFADQFDDNTRTYNFEFSGSIALTAQVSVFFYFGLDGKFGASIASGDTRSLGVNSYWSFGGNIGIGNKDIANIGVSGEYKKSLGMLEAINGSYTSIKHFMAFLDLNMYSFMEQNDWDVLLYKMGIDDNYWSHVMSQKGDVYNELSKGYTRKVNTSILGQLEGGVNGVGGFNVGYQSIEAESYEVDKIESIDQIKAYSKIKSNDQLTRYNKNDVSSKIFTTLTFGEAAECKLSFDTIESSLNSNTLGEYINFSLTINEYNIKGNTNGEQNSNGIKTIYGFVVDLATAYNSSDTKTVTDWAIQPQKNSTELKDHSKWVGRSEDRVSAIEQKRLTDYEVKDQELKEKIAKSEETYEHNKKVSENTDHKTNKQKAEQRADRARAKKDSLLQKQEENRLKAEIESQKAKTEIQRLQKKGEKLENNIERIKKFKTLFQDKFNKLRKEKLKGSANSSSTEYTKVNVCLQIIPGDFRLHYIKFSTGMAFSAKAGVSKAGWDVSGELKGIEEVEALEIMGTNTIAYASLVYNSIYKEGIKRLIGNKKKEYDNFTKDILGDIQKGDHNRILSMVHNEYIQQLGEYTSVIADYNFEKIMGRVLHSFEMGSIYSNSFEISKWPPKKQMNFVRAVEYIKDNISPEKYPSLVLAYAEQMKSYGQTGAMDCLRELILGEDTANKQWSKFKDTRGQVRASDNLLSIQGVAHEGFEKVTGLELKLPIDELKTIAVNFGVKVKIAVECYAKDVPNEQATWNDCPIDDLSPGQAHLYLGDIKSIVKYIQDKNPKKNTSAVEASEFMKSLINDDYDSNKIDLSVFEKDILFPLLIENIIYGKQLPKN
ncbi:hypothetical protein [Flammeovirga aprica]|uniref:Uncharacterized protein n=1 Tax=Flammeovirga aprica JL-4 TaxID=694437 RepID=A0A7X9XC71_9BACT|nr:hypothetical protein [Flammeovirga aprica]NME71324.1 hypothetical protein [Flammeovirga aprica JL-4]